MSILGYDNNTATLTGIADVYATNAYIENLFLGSPPVDIVADLTAIQAEVDTLQIQMTTANSNISTLQGQMTTANSNISTLQGQYTTLNGEVNTLQSEMNTAQSDINDLQADVIAIGVTLGATSATVAGLVISQASQDTTITAQGISIGVLNGEMNTAQSDINDLEVKTTDQSWGSLTGTSFSTKVNVGGGAGVVLNTGSASEFNSGITTDLVRSFNNNNLVIEGRGTGDAILKTNGVNRIRAYDTGVIDIIGTGTTTVEGSGIAINATTAGIQTFATTSTLIQSGTTTTLTSGGETEINCTTFDINATGAYTLDATTYTLTTTALAGTAMTWVSNTTGSDLILSNPTAGAFSIEAGAGEDLIFATTGTGDMAFNSTADVFINPTLTCEIQAQTGLTLATATGDFNMFATGAGATLTIQGTNVGITGTTNVNTTGTLATSIGNTTGNLTLRGATNTILAQTNMSLETTAGDLNILANGAGAVLNMEGTFVAISGNTAINTVSTQSTTIGNTTGSIALRGTTNINTTTTSATNIGNTTGALALTGSTNTILGITDINNTGALATRIGNASGNLSLQGSTNTILGTTNINVAGNLATSIGNSAGNLALTGNINTVLGTTNINRTGDKNTSIGNTGTITLTGSTLASTTTGNSTITSSGGDLTLSGTDVFINTTGTSVGEVVVRANTNVDIKANNGNLELNALTTMLLTSGGTQTVFVDTANKMVTTTNTTTLTNATINLEGNTNVNVDNTFNMMPTATIIQNVSSTVPSGFLYCDGVAVSRSTYSRLFSAIGTTFGIGDGLTTFNKPNFQGAFLRGVGTQTVGGTVQTAGAVGTAQNQALQDHKHTYSDMMWWDTDTGGGSGQTIFVAGADFQTPGGDTVGSNGDGNFSNRLTKATYPSTAVNPGTPIQQWNAPTNVSAFTGLVTHPMNYSVYYYIRY